LRKHRPQRNTFDSTSPSENTAPKKLKQQETLQEKVIRLQGNTASKNGSAHFARESRAFSQSELKGSGKRWIRRRNQKRPKKILKFRRRLREMRSGSSLAQLIGPALWSCGSGLGS
jgi:hypothetical protein